MHIVIVHELVLHVFTVKLYSCDLCEYKTKQKGELKNRIESVHGNASHSCDQCDYKAKLKWGFKRQNRTADKMKYYTMINVSIRQNRRNT